MQPLRLLLQLLERCYIKPWTWMFTAIIFLLLQTLRAARCLSTAHPFTQRADSESSNRLQFATTSLMASATDPRHRLRAKIPRRCQDSRSENMGREKTDWKCGLELITMVPALEDCTPGQAAEWEPSKDHRSLELLNLPVLSWKALTKDSFSWVQSNLLHYCPHLSILCFYFSRRAYWLKANENMEPCWKIVCGIKQELCNFQSEGYNVPQQEIHRKLSKKL